MSPLDGVFKPKLLGTALSEQKTFGVGFTKYKDWELSVELNPDANQYEGFGNVLHFSVPPSDDVSLTWEDSPGGRIPAIYQVPKSGGNKLRIHHHVNGPNTYWDTPVLAAGWHTLKIANRANECGSFKYTVTIDGKQEYSVENKTPKVWEYVSAYISNSRLHYGVSGSYRNLRFESKSTDLSYLNHFFKLEIFVLAIRVKTSVKVFFIFCRTRSC